MKINIKYMVSSRCKEVVQTELDKQGLLYGPIDLGEVEIMGIVNAEQRNQLKESLLTHGLELMEDPKAILIEKIRNTIIQVVHHSDQLPKTNFSNYVSQKLGYDYTYLANLFSSVTGTTIEQYIIIHKIERVKELLSYDELNLTQISYQLQYSSVSHLSSQFKKVTGLTPSYFKKSNYKRVPLEDL
ncbi:helix-turn-helix domain-containing protein [Salmonirosea aquatica]|uniref:Helix-turn-helix domain-containing protein n=1 Tax=Salmonirosea aquatica TaxID=2654236 RepID=A0A7C9FNI5_9BACT|nr:helix-turn-helix domain-containing protein [Cytophagaceae bacterium SJW1-29]